MRSAFLWLHRWLGLSVGLVVAFLGVSGSLLVFRHELDAKLNPHLLHVKPKPERASWQTLYDEVRRTYPEGKVSFVFLGRTPEMAHEWWLDGGELRVYSDPYSGRVLGARGEREGFFPWLYTAHTTLFIGETGEKIAGWCGLVLAALSLSGLVLWFPRRGRSGRIWNRAFKPHLKTNWRGKNYELHRIGGFWVAGWLLMASLSGASLVFPDAATKVFSVFGAAPAQRKAKIAPGKWLPLDDLVAQAEAAFPDGRITRLSFPAKAGAPFVVRKKLAQESHPNGMNNITLDPATGRILHINDTRHAAPQERLMHLRFPLHIGNWGGNASRVLTLLLGWTPLLLGVSGFLMWRSTRRINSRAKTARSLPAEADILERKSA